MSRHVKFILNIHLIRKIYKKKYVRYTYIKWFLYVSIYLFFYIFLYVSPKASRVTVRIYLLLFESDDIAMFGIRARRVFSSYWINYWPPRVGNIEHEHSHCRLGKRQKRTTFLRVFNDGPQTDCWGRALIRPNPEAAFPESRSSVSNIINFQLVKCNIPS